MGVFFMTPELEIAYAAFADLSIDMINSDVTWRLPVSKTDTRALGTSRSWGCVCNNEKDTACPFHAAIDHVEYIRTVAAYLECPVRSLPLLPDSLGEQISKEAAVETITKLAERTGAATRGARNRPLVGGHCLRIGGAVTLASIGIDASYIECLARWSSPMVLHHAKLAPLKNLTHEYVRRVREAVASAATIECEMDGESQADFNPKDVNIYLGSSLG